MLLGAGDALGCGVAVGELDGFIVVVGTAVAATQNEICISAQSFQNDVDVAGLINRKAISVIRSTAGNGIFKGDDTAQGSSLENNRGLRIVIGDRNINR